jgi:hypothetical protein
MRQSGKKRWSVKETDHANASQTEFTVSPETVQAFYSIAQMYRLIRIDERSQFRLVSALLLTHA